MVWFVSEEGREERQRGKDGVGAGERKKEEGRSDRKKEQGKILR